MTRRSTSIPISLYTTLIVSPSSIFSRSLYLSFSVVDAKSTNDTDVSNLIVPILFFSIYFSAFARSSSSVGTSLSSELSVEVSLDVFSAVSIVELEEVDESVSSSSSSSENSEVRSSIKIRSRFIAFASGVLSQMILSLNSTCVTLVSSSELEELLLGITSA